MFKRSLIAALAVVSLSLAHTARCDDKAQAEDYVALASGFEFGQRNGQQAHGYGLNVGFGIDLNRGAYTHVYVNSFSKRFTGQSTFVQSSVGVAAVDGLFAGEFSSAKPAVGASYTFGSEWSWSSGFIAGVDWAKLTALVTYSNETFVPILSPGLLGLRLGWSFG
jgi:hypothetical protein